MKTALIAAWFCFVFAGLTGCGGTTKGKNSDLDKPRSADTTK